MDGNGTGQYETDRIGNCLDVGLLHFSRFQILKLSDLLLEHTIR